MLLFLTACGNVLYLSKLGWHQSFITFHSVPVEEVLKDESTSAQWKEKIGFIQEVMGYGQKKLGLKKTKSYSNFFEVKGPILYVVTASEKDRLQLYTWNFPVTGRVTYKCFFTKEGVLKEKQFLEKKELDTFVQQVGAYSTLGWLRDPIFSSMMEWNHVALVNLILHEMTHATVYFKDETDFNEGDPKALYDFHRKLSNMIIYKHIRQANVVAHREPDLSAIRWSRWLGRGIYG